MPANAPQGLCPKCLLMGVALPTNPGGAPNIRPAPPSLEALRAAFPQLEVVELIGQGGMGAVFKARQPKLNRFVALKILPEAMSRDAAFAERFTREAQMLARLHHPNIVTVHDFGQANGFFYLLMEFVEGVNLRQAMAAAPFTPEQALTIVPMICEALQYAHDEGVLHRDIKPENILLDTKGRVRLVDFGIAKLAAANCPRVGAGAEQPSDAALTQSGSALGTPKYMAPEQQANPETVDQRADIYSLGVVFYEMLTGELPVGRFAPPSHRTPLDPRIDDVVLRALAQQKEKRFASAHAVRTTIEAITATPSSPTIPPAAEGYPVLLSPAFARMLTAGFALLTGFLVYQMRFSRFFLSMLWSRLESDWLQATAMLAGLAGVAWLALWVWRRRDWILAPLRDRRLWSGRGQSGSSSWADSATTDWLRISCLAFTGVLAVELLWMLLSYVLLVTQALANRSAMLAFSMVLPFGAMVSPGLLGMVLVVVLVRRELRRQDTGPAQPVPAWLQRAALLFVLFGLVTSAPMPRGDVQMGIAVFSFGGFSAIGAIAILTRSRIWRALALALFLQLVFLGSAGLIIFGRIARSIPEWSQHVGPITATTLAIIIQSFSLCCYEAGLIALLLPSSRAAFGLQPRTPTALTEPPGAQ
jgi:serine/threonine protein kinase